MTMLRKNLAKLTRTQRQQLVTELTAEERQFASVAVIESARAQPKVISLNIHTAQAGRIKMSPLGRSGFRSSLDSTTGMACLVRDIPFS